MDEKPLNPPQIITKKARKTVLIFGVSSFVGSNLAEFLHKYYRVIGTYFTKPVEIPGVLTVQCDALNRDAVQMVLYSFRPNITIYCVGLTSLEDCHRYEKLADALNTAAVFNVITFSERYKSQFIYFSTSFIFSGEDKIYLENDPPSPLNAYGNAKLAAEYYIQKSCLNYLIFRNCNFYGRSVNPNTQTWFESMQIRMAKEEGFTTDAMIHFGFLDVHYLGMILKLAIDMEMANRLYQVSSQDICTFHDFVKTYCEIFKAGMGLVRKGQWPFPETKGDLVDNVELKNQRFFRLSIKNAENVFRMELPTIKESLQYTFQRFGGSTVVKGKITKTNTVQFI